MAQDKQSLQQEIDYQLGEAGGRMLSFVLRDKEGDCSVPNNVHIRFYNCTFTTFKSEKNNNFFFSGCTFDGTSNNFTLQNSNAIMEKTKINSKITFTSSKIELLECEVNKNLIIRDKSFLKSIKSTFKGSTDLDTIGILCSKNSTVESYKDAWSGWKNCFWQAIDFSYIKIDKPTKIEDVSKTIGSSDNYSSITLTGSKPIKINTSTNEFPAFKTTNKSSITVKNIDKIESNSNLFSAETNAKVILTNILHLVTKNIVVKLDDSECISTNCPSFVSSDLDTINILNDGVFTITGVKTITGKTSAFNIETGNLNLIGDNSTSIKATNSTIKATTGSSNIFIKNVKSIESESGSSLNLKNSNASLVNIELVQGGTNSPAISSVSGSLRLIDITTIDSKGSEVLFLNSYTKVYGLNIDKINSRGTGSAIHLNNGSIFIGKNILSIKGVDTGINVEGTSRLIIKNSDLIQGQSGNGLVIGHDCSITGMNIKTISGAGGTGIKSTSTRGKLDLKNIGLITGNKGIDISNTDLKLDNSGISSSTVEGGILAKSVNEGSYTLELVGPLEVKGGTNTITGYVLKDRGVSWLGDLSLESVVNKTEFSSVSGDVGLNKTDISQQRGKISGKVTAIANSIFKSFRSQVGGNTTATNSIIDLAGTGINNLSLASSAYFGLNSKLGTTTVADSFLGAFLNRIGAVTLTGKSTAIGGALTDSTFDFASDPDASTPVSLFSAGSGDFTLQADGDLIFESYNLKHTLRNDYILRAERKIDMQSVSTAKIESTSADILIKGSTQIVLNNTSSITMTTADITLVASGTVTV